MARRGPQHGRARRAGLHRRRRARSSTLHAAASSRATARIARLQRRADARGDDRVPARPAAAGRRRRGRGRVNFRNLEPRRRHARAQRTTASSEELRELVVDERRRQVRPARAPRSSSRARSRASYLLTAAYDSEKDTKRAALPRHPARRVLSGLRRHLGERLRRAIDRPALRPHRQADSRYLLYGDFVTRGRAATRASLGNYSRCLTGVSEHYENNRVVAQRVGEPRRHAAGHRGDPRQRHVRSVLRSAQRRRAREQREGRDHHARPQPAEPDPRDRAAARASPTTRSSRSPAASCSSAPVPSLDANLNPISIRVTYEVEQGGDKFWVYGVDGARSDRRALRDRRRLRAKTTTRPRTSTSGRRNSPGTSTNKRARSPRSRRRTTLATRASPAASTCRHQGERLDAWGYCEERDGLRQSELALPERPHGDGAQGPSYEARTARGWSATRSGPRTRRTGARGAAPRPTSSGRSAAGCAASSACATRGRPRSRPASTRRSTPRSRPTST